MDDLISRKQAIDAFKPYAGYESNRTHSEWVRRITLVLEELPSAQPEPSEITDEQAILHLQSTGWMQNHDREMYESGLRERLADDSGDYDNLIPCKDTISRQAALDVLKNIDCSDGVGISALKCDAVDDAVIAINELPSAQPEQIARDIATIIKNERDMRVMLKNAEQRWIPCSERYPDMDERVLVYTVANEYHVWDCMSNRADNYFWEDEDGLYHNKYEVDGWMPLPEPYEEEDNVKIN